MFLNLPQRDGRIVTSRTIFTAPRESLLSETKVLGHRQNRKRQAALQRVPITIAHVVRLVPEESLVEVDVGHGLVADRYGCWVDRSWA